VIQMIETALHVATTHDLTLPSAGWGPDSNPPRIKTPASGSHIHQCPLQ
jgi:hypothetical protein